MALDFDGTLAPISPLPGDARPLDGVHQILRAVRATGATLAVITGRSVASLLRVSGFAAVPGIVVYGTHGAERWQAGTLRTAAAPPGLDELRASLPGLLASIGPDLWLEDKSLSLVVHARLTDDPDRMLAMLHAPVEQAAAAAGLVVRPGREVLEICIPGIDKGTAIRELVSEDTAAAFYAGRRPRRPARHPGGERVGRAQRPARADRRGWPRPGRRAGRRHRAGPAGPAVAAAPDPPTARSSDSRERSTDVHV